MKKYLLATLLLCSCSFLHTRAQVGFKLNFLTPRGDIGPYFKSTVAYELFFLADEMGGKVRGRFGVFYANFKPRMDSYPIYGTRYDGTTQLLPGSLTYHHMDMKCIFLDQNVLLFHKNNLAFYAGIGLIFGKSNLKYDREIETLITETGASEDRAIGGARGNVQVVYTIGNHIQLCAEAQHSAMTVTDWSSAYSNNTYGIGINYRFKSN